MAEEQINLRGTLTNMQVGDVLTLGSKTNWNSLRYTTSTLKADKGLSFVVNRKSDGEYQVTRIY